MNPAIKEYEALANTNVSEANGQIAALPLSKIAANRPLLLESGINPAWSQTMQVFWDEVGKPLLGEKDSLEHEEWVQIRQKFAAYEAWMDAKQGQVVESLGINRVRTMLDSGLQGKITALIEQDKALESTFDAIISVNRLIRYHRDLFRLLNNFVSFSDFYAPGYQAIFQAGSLYIDGRSCEFCLKISDMDKHSTMANLSGTYLAYCECNRRQGTDKMIIVAAFTNGDADNLMVGRNGVFYDRQGNDWDATIIKIIEHPISVKQAFWYPYKRIGKMISQQIEKMASAGEKAVQDKASAGLSEVVQTGESGKSNAVPFDVGKFAGIFAAIGLAIGAIGTAIAAVITGFLSLTLWQMPLAIAGLLLLVSGPSVIIAYLKLRKRNLAPLLDGNGWAVNTRAIINIPFGASLTKIAALPPGAEHSSVDPFEEKKSPWKLYLFILIVLGSLFYVWDKGYVHKGHIERLQKHIMGDASNGEADKPSLDDLTSKSIAQSENLPEAEPTAIVNENEQAHVAGEVLSDNPDKIPSASVVPMEKPAQK
ncbi:MAG: phage holin family protein [Burkholderiales bacterium]|nr:phage holin family protein [Burkholderiales bacterium]MDR4515969.1 hypothetical protein [Nitrosomonas sp.]